MCNQGANETWYGALTAVTVDLTIISRAIVISERHKLSVLYITHDVGFFASHRLPVALGARAAGYHVSIAGPSSEWDGRLEDEGLGFIPIEMPRGMLNPLSQIEGAWNIFRTISKRRPSLVHLIASKPVIFGGIAARLSGIPSVSAISGLGHVFIETGFKAWLTRQLVLLGYRHALRGPHSYTIFQNETNRSLFIRNGVKADKTVLIRGSGTDLTQFDPSPSGNTTPVVLLPARMLWTKGVAEFCEAAQIIAQRGVAAKFIMVGDPYLGNPASINREELAQLAERSGVEARPHETNIAALMHASDIVALPSYSEGFPKSLIDAAAAGRPTVTTDISGCRDAIESGVTGLLVERRNAVDLADKLEILIRNADLRMALGRNGRMLAEREFAIERIVSQHLELYHRISQDRLSPAPQFQ